MTIHKEYETHPAYGMAVFSRCQGSPGRLFGSQLQRHGAFISLTIKRAERTHHLGQDWIHGREELIEVFFSASQFAQLLTTMNVGDGTPCTIRHIEGKRTPVIPEDEVTEQERCHADFENKIKELHQNVDKRIKELTNMLNTKASINKTDRQSVMSLLEYIQRETKANMPFQLEAFQEQVEKTVQHAKAEVDAMLTTSIHNAGLEALKGKIFNEHKALPALDEEA